MPPKDAGASERNANASGAPPAEGSGGAPPVGNSTTERVPGVQQGAVQGSLPDIPTDRNDSQDMYDDMRLTLCLICSRPLLHCRCRYDPQTPPKTRPPSRRP